MCWSARHPGPYSREVVARTQLERDTAAGKTELTRINGYSHCVLEHD